MVSGLEAVVVALAAAAARFLALRRLMSFCFMVMRLGVGILMVETGCLIFLLALKMG